MSNNKLLDDANRLWKMLDEMSENDPVCYRKFINRQMESFRKTTSPPIIRFVVKLTQKLNKQPLLVNFCEWSVIPEPESSDIPISVKCGDMFTINEVNAITLAFNSKVFTEHNFNESLKNDQIHNEEIIYSQSMHDDNRYQLVWLGLNYLEKEKSLSTIESVSVEYSNNPIRPKLLKPSDKYGSEQQVFKSIGFLINPIKTNTKLNHEVDWIKNLTPETLMELKNSRSIVNNDDDAINDHDVDLCSSSTKSLKLSTELSNYDQKSSFSTNEKVLIEEINETSVDSHDATLGNMNSISWSAKVINSNSTKQSNKVNQLKLTFALPGIKSGKQCNVDLTINRVKLEVVDSSVEFYPLDLRLPCKIETDLAEAKFNSRKEKLIILVPIISSP
uniref:PIH1_CS domain-containing protein n=1 Tax=Schistosoma mansoni TaxID=6183 RepID=A0A3Q0KRE9_SCHMA